MALMFILGYQFVTADAKQPIVLYGSIKHSPCLSFKIESDRLARNWVLELVSSPVVEVHKRLRFHLGGPDSFMRLRGLL